MFRKKKKSFDQPVSLVKETKHNLDFEKKRRSNFTTILTSNIPGSYLHRTIPGNGNDKLKFIYNGGHITFHKLQQIINDIRMPADIENFTNNSFDIILYHSYNINKSYIIYQMIIFFIISGLLVYIILGLLNEKKPDFDDHKDIYENFEDGSEILEDNYKLNQDNINNKEKKKIEIEIQR